MIKSNKMRELRLKKGLSQKDFAKLINVAPNTYNQWEKGTREPDYETLCKIAKELNTTIDYLLGYENSTYRLRTLREKIKKVSQRELADYLNIDKSTYAQYEKGICEPDTATLNKLSDYYNVSVEFLLGRTDTTEAIEKQLTINEIIELLPCLDEFEIDEVQDHIAEILNRQNQKKDISK